MARYAALAALVGLSTMIAVPGQNGAAPDRALVAHARALLKQSPLIDGHNDYAWAVREHVPNRDLNQLDISKPQPSLMTDIARLRAGGLGGQFWSVYVPVELQGQTAVTATLEQIDIVYRMLRKYPETFELALTADDVERIFTQGKIASLIGMEGGHSIDNSLGDLRMFYKLGARYMTLTHTSNTGWADSATDTPKFHGLSPFGEDVVREMNWLGMLVDLSHVSPETMAAAIRVSQAPVIFSHSSARALVDHPRDVPDDILKLLPANGGVIMVAFVPGFVSAKVNDWNKQQTAEGDRLKALHPSDAAAVKSGVEAWTAAHPMPEATIADVADHIDHIRHVAGIDHIGLGSDFDGITQKITGLDDVSKYPYLLAELLRRGYSDDDVKKIMGLNVLRVLRGAEQVAKRLQAERGPSTAIFAPGGGVAAPTTDPVAITAAFVRQQRAGGWRASGPDADGWLWNAARTGDAALVRALFDAGANARMTGDDGTTLVMMAASSGDPDTVRAVLDAGGDPTARDHNGRNAADRVRDALADQHAPRRPYEAILKLLTDE